MLPSCGTWGPGLVLQPPGWNTMLPSFSWTRYSGTFSLLAPRPARLSILSTRLTPTTHLPLTLHLTLHLTLPTRHHNPTPPKPITLVRPLALAVLLAPRLTGQHQPAVHADGATATAIEVLAVGAVEVVGALGEGFAGGVSGGGCARSGEWGGEGEGRRCQGEGEEVLDCDLEKGLGGVCGKGQWDGRRKQRYLHCC